MKTPIRKVVLFLVGLTLAIGCAGSYSNLKVKSEYDPMADMSRLKTYDFAPGLKITSKDKRVNADFVQSKIQAAVEKDLGEKNFQKINSAATLPDFWISYQAFLDKKEKAQILWDWEEQIYSEDIKHYEVTYDQGTILLTVVNPQNGKVIWKGSAKAEVDMDIPWNEKEKRINNVVEIVLNTFPPKN